MVRPILLLSLASLAAASDFHKEGVELYKQHKYTDAISALETAAQTEPADSSDYQESALLIGQSYFMLSQAPKSIPWLAKLPKVNEANYMLGYAYLQTGNKQAAEEAFARLFQLKPDSAPAHLVAAQMMLKKEYEQEALSEANKAIALDPKLPEAHFLVGEIAIFRGHLDEAESELKQELALNPNFFMAWYRLGDAFSRQQQWQAAIENLERAVWLNQEFSGPLILLGKCYFKTGNLTNAEGVLRRALTLDPKNASATYLLGQTLIGEGKTEEGRATLAKVQGLRDPQ